MLLLIDELMSIFRSWFSISYRENVLDDTKAVFRCTLCHLKRFLVHGIGIRRHRAVINGTGESWRRLAVINDAGESWRRLAVINNAGESW